MGLFIFPLNNFAQKGVEDLSKYGHGEDSIRCVTNYSLYREYSRQRDYKMALTYWRGVFNECPLVSKNLYIDGVKFISILLKRKMISLFRKNSLTP
ncbi:MAG: hypothetical protein HC906_01715 [Bacteroidales bacterium]|nr:hypothetical protein [Bacteroidales bacterium]